MSLLDDIRAASGPSRPGCKVAAIRAELGEKDAAELDAAIADAGLSASAILGVLRKRGLAIGDHALRAHRKQMCTCYRT